MEEPNKKYVRKSTTKGRCYQYLAALSASSAVLALGVNSAWTSPYIPYLLSNSSSIPTTNNEASWCAGSPFGGCLLGSILAANLVDLLGRKRSLLLLAPITFTSFIGIAFATRIWHITALRFTIGITDGAIYTVLPMYIGEVADPEIREFLSSSTYYLLIIGTLFINIIGPFLDIFASSLIVAILPATHFLIFLFMPESPYHYVKSGKYKEAENSLQVLNGFHDVNEELNSLRDIIEMEDEVSTNPKFSDLFTIPSNRKACFIYFILMFVNTASGKTAIMLYTTTIFEESGSTINPTLSVIIYTLVELIVVIIVTLFVADKFGKRPLMIISSTGCSISIFVLAVYLYLKHCESYLIAYLNWVPIISLVIYNIIFSFGIGFGHLTYLSEIFPMNVKANATCMSQLVYIGFGVIFAQFFQITHLSFGLYVPFFCFALFCGLGVIFIYKFVPETKGKTLEEIQTLLTYK